MTLIPRYTSLSLGSINALARLLQLPINRVSHLAENSSSYYRVAKITKKKNGDKRVTYDAFKVLKDVHRKLKNQLFNKVIYPDYLQGSLRGRSYLSNVKKHTKSKLLICEDITNFFPSISAEQVEKMFMRLFSFPKCVAEILTKLVTLNGCVPQGGVCSSYIANLVMWNKEAVLVEKLISDGLRYTRYVDDITVSSRRYVTKEKISEVIALIYGMLGHYGVKPNRAKHEVLGNGSHQTVHRVGVNGSQASFGKDEKKRIRSAVHKLDTMFHDNNCSYTDYLKAFGSVSSKVGKLKQLNEHQATKFRGQLNIIRPSVKRLKLDIDNS